MNEETRDAIPEQAARQLDLMDRYWRAANYVSVGQIYLLDNPLLREPLRAEHVKPRLLGHWGTTPGLNFIYVHLNRAIRERGVDVLYICGPGHGGPAMVANTWLEGSYSEIYPEIGRGAEGMKRLFRQFSFPGGVPSHAAPETPGSIHEGGELGYALVHAFGAAFDNPDLVVACVVGDGEAETGPLAPGTPTSSLTRRVTEPCCQSCISTATRSPTRRCSQGWAATNFEVSSWAMDMSHSSSRATTPSPCTARWRPRLTPRSTASRSSRKKLGFLAGEAVGHSGR